MRVLKRMIILLIVAVATTIGVNAAEVAKTTNAFRLNGKNKGSIS